MERSEVIDVCVCVMASPDVEWFPPAWVLIRHSSEVEQHRDTQLL